MGFDVGLFLANLLLAYFAADAHGAERQEQREWLLACVAGTWSCFTTRFLQLWTSAGGGDRYMERVWEDTVGFAGAEMIRRIVGIAHVEDFERLSDPETRARCERKALEFGRRMLVYPEHLRDVGTLCAIACEL
jgi:5-methylthioribose kinase